MLRNEHTSYADLYVADPSKPKYLEYLQPVAKEDREYVGEPQSTKTAVLSNAHLVTWTFLNPPNADISHQDIRRYQAWELTNILQQRFIQSQSKKREYAEKFRPELLGPDNHEMHVTGVEPEVREHMNRLASTRVHNMWWQLIRWQQYYIDDTIVIHPENAHGRKAGSGWKKPENPVSQAVDPHIRQYTHVIRRIHQQFPVLVVRMPHRRLSNTFYYRMLLPTDVDKSLFELVSKAYNYNDNDTISARELQKKYKSNSRRHVTYDTNYSPIEIARERAREGSSSSSRQVDLDSFLDTYFSNAARSTTTTTTTTTTDAINSPCVTQYNNKQADTGSRQKGECVVCLENEPTIVVIPCGHLCVCPTCASSLQTCPLCRNSVTKKQVVYF